MQILKSMYEHLIALRMSSTQSRLDVHDARVCVG